jgi:hypothetical protein
VSDHYAGGPFNPFNKAAKNALVGVRSYNLVWLMLSQPFYSLLLGNPRRVRQRTAV